MSEDIMLHLVTNNSNKYTEKKLKNNEVINGKPQTCNELRYWYLKKAALAGHKLQRVANVGLDGT